MDTSFEPGAAASANERLATVAFVSPFAITFVGTLALAIAPHPHTAASMSFEWFVILAPTVFLQSTILLPLGLRGLRRIEARTGRPPRAISFLVWSMALASIGLLIASSPAALERF